MFGLTTTAPHLDSTKNVRSTAPMTCPVNLGSLPNWCAAAPRAIPRAFTFSKQRSAISHDARLGQGLLHLSGDARRAARNGEKAVQEPKKRARLLAGGRKIGRNRTEGRLQL